jgi:hypothetical protein
MSTSLDTLHRCTLGGSSFQLEDFTYGGRPVVNSGVRIGTEVVLRGEGWLEAGDAAALAAAISAAMGSCQVSGKDFEVFGPGNVSLLKLPSAQCLNGGPHVSFEIEGGLQDAGQARHFNFELSAQTIEVSGGGGEETPASYALTLETSPDGLRVVTWTGDIAAAAGDAYEQFTKLLEEFAKGYALPTWVVSHRFEQNVAGDRGRFTVRAVESAEPLPAADPEDFAVDGTGSSRLSRDEQMRMTLVLEYNLAFRGDVDKLVALLRPQEWPVLSETVERTRFPHPQVHATFVTLTGGNGNALMNWDARLDYTAPGVGIYEERRYSGLPPVLVLSEQSVGRLVFSGSLVGAGVYIDPPQPPAGLVLLERPRRVWAEPNGIERRTEWTYALAIAPGDKVKPEDVVKLLARPLKINGKDVPPIPRPLFGSAGAAT